MMKRLLAVLLALALLGSGLPARAAQATAGAQPFSFLGLDSSARAAALGGAYTALAVDAEALHYNPAGLGFIVENEASAMHNQYFESATQEHLAVALRPGVAVSADILNYGSLSRTTYSSPNGGLGTFSIMDTALTAGGGYAFGPVSLGAAAKWLREDNDATVGQAVAFDGGALWRLPWVPGLSLGAAAQNLGGKVRFQSTGEALPVTGRAGAAWTFPAFGHQNSITADASKEGSDKVRFSGGVETVAGGSLALRLGYTTRVDAGLGISAGVGWRGEAWSIDYAIAPYGDLGLTHRVGVGFRWGRGDEPVREAGPDPVIEAALRASRRREAARTPDSSLPSEVVMGGDASPTAPLPAEARLAKARGHLVAGRLTEAKVELDAADLLLAPEDRLRATWHELNGRLARAHRDLKTARAEYTESLRMAVKSGVGGQSVADAYEGMGLTLADQGELAYAARFLRKAYEIAPTQRLLDSIEALERRLPK
jgi:tetratricopeptide (TPR) repeat protein